MYILSMIIIMAISSRFFMRWADDADSANSPIVWFSFLEKGFSVLTDWYPTADNWYFTVYPVHFALFYIFDNSSSFPVMLATGLFIWVIAFLCSRMALKYSAAGSLMALLCLTFIPAKLYINGFAAHPFSHNSTNAFGIIILAIYLKGIINRGIAWHILGAMLIVSSSVSDPWLLPAFALPIILAEVFRLALTKSKEVLFPLFLYSISFAISASGVIQNLLGIPITHFELAGWDQIVTNGVNAALITGKILPLIPYYNEPIAYLTSIIWVFVITFFAYLCISEKGSKSVLAIACLFSIAGVYSSSIVGNQLPHPRFYLNIVPMAVLILAVTKLGKYNFIRWFIFSMLLISSIFSYFDGAFKNTKSEHDVVGFVTFMDKHDLTYGYGSFWNHSMAANWYTKGRIHTTPVYFDGRTGKIDFQRTRYQSFRSWHEQNYVNSRRKDRQFIQISKGATADQCRDVSLCITGVTSQVGEPGDIITYKDSTFLIYNRQIKPTP